MKFITQRHLSSALPCLYTYFMYPVSDKHGGVNVKVYNFSFMSISRTRMDLIRKSGYDKLRLTHTASELDFNSALTTKDHRGYVVGRLSPMIEVVGVTSIPPTGYDVCSTIV